jgi:hypothetical protein
LSEVNLNSGTKTHLNTYWKQRKIEGDKKALRSIRVLLQIQWNERTDGKTKELQMQKDENQYDSLAITETTE